jgi:hypothetical protein
VWPVGEARHVEGIVLPEEPQRSDVRKSLAVDRGQPRRDVSAQERVDLRWLRRSRLFQQQADVTVPSERQSVSRLHSTVRYDGITHDFMMLNPLSDTHAKRAAIVQAIAVLRNALHTT